MVLGKITTTFKKIIEENQLFIFNSKGSLIYKKWLWKDKGRMFHENEGLGEKLNNKK